MSAISPKAFPLLISMIVAPIVDVVTSVIGALADRAACKYNKKRGDKKRGGAAPAGKSWDDGPLAWWCIYIYSSQLIDTFAKNSIDCVKVYNL